MSQYNSAEKEHTKEPWERTLEMDYPDTDTSTIRTLESGALMTSIDYNSRSTKFRNTWMKLIRSAIKIGLSSLKSAWKKLG